MLPAKEESHSPGVHIWSTSCFKNKNGKSSSGAAQRWEGSIIPCRTWPGDACMGQRLTIRTLQTNAEYYSKPDQQSNRNSSRRLWFRSRLCHLLAMCPEILWGLVSSAVRWMSPWLIEKIVENYSCSSTQSFERQLESKPSHLSLKQGIGLASSSSALHKCAHNGWSTFPSFLPNPFYLLSLSFWPPTNLPHFCFIHSQSLRRIRCLGISHWSKETRS